MRARWCALALAAAVGLAWSQVLDAPFTYDDRIEVVGNRTIRFLGDPAAIATYNISRPLLILSYALNWEFGGLDPRGYHLVSILVHIANMLLAWRFTRRLLAPARAALVAGLWALHPMTTEAVTYITGRSDALEATSWLVALTAWVDYRRGALRARWVALAAVGTALLTKELGIFLPFALLGVDRALGVRAPRALLPLGLAGAGAVLARISVSGWPEPEVPRSALAQLLSQAEVWAVYLRLWVFPFGQSILHDHPDQARLLGAGLTAAWALFLAYAWRRGGWTALAAAGWVSWLLPSSLFPLLETIAEHRSYLAGFFLLFGVVAAAPAPRWGWAALPLLFSLTWTRNDTWRSEVSLWRDASEKNPASYRAMYGYGEALRYSRRYVECAGAYRAASGLDPTNANALINLGICRAEAGDAPGAREYWERVLELDPGSCDAHNNLGTLASREGNPESAEAEYASSLRNCPDDAIAHLNLANLAYARGDVRKAAYHYRSYLRVAEDGPAAPLARERLHRLNVE